MAFEATCGACVELMVTPIRGIAGKTRPRGGAGDGGGEGGGGEGGGGEGRGSVDQISTSARLSNLCSPRSTIVTYVPVIP